MITSANVTCQFWHPIYPERTSAVVCYFIRCLLYSRRWREESLGRYTLSSLPPQLPHSVVYSLKLRVSSVKHEHSRSRDRQPERTCLLVTCYAMYHLMQHAWWKNGGGEAAHRRPVSHSEKHMNAPVAGWTEALVSVGPFNGSFFNEISRIIY